jgi:hypothetical protein
LAYAAIAVWCVTAIIGAFAARRGYRKWRHRGQDGAQRGTPAGDESEVG